MLWGFARLFLDLFGPTVFRASIEGVEKLPADGPLIVAANHVSWYDPPLVGWAVDKRRSPYFLGKAELFKNAFSRWFLAGLHSIPLDRGRGDVGALRKAEDLLRAGGCLALFPEGTRSRTGVPGRPKPGIGFLAQRTGATVVPAHVRGTRENFGPMRVRFGEPMRYSGGEDKVSYQAFAESVMEAVFKLDS